MYVSGTRPHVLAPRACVCVCVCEPVCVHACARDCFRRRWRCWKTWTSFSARQVTGINAALVAAGVTDGDTVAIGGASEFVWSGDKRESVLYGAWLDDMKARGMGRQGTHAWPSVSRPAEGVGWWVGRQVSERVRG